VHGAEFVRSLVTVVVVEVVGPMIRRWSGVEKVVENKDEMDGEES
jgi:hypothetical protein